MKYKTVKIEGQLHNYVTYKGYDIVIVGLSHHIYSPGVLGRMSKGGPGSDISYAQSMSGAK